jgi:hypothetical protein
MRSTATEILREHACLLHMEHDKPGIPERGGSIRSLPGSYFLSREVKRASKYVKRQREPLYEMLDAFTMNREEIERRR